MSTSLSSIFSKYGTTIAVPCFFIGVVLLIYFIAGVIKLVDRSRIFSVPLLEHQIIEFSEAQKVILCGEGPRFTRRFAKLDFVLKTDDGTPVDGRTIWIHSRSSGISKVRVELKSYQIPRAGRYRFEIQGLGESRDNDAEHRIVFMKPHLFKTVGYVIGIVFSALLFIGSIVLFFLSLLLPKSSA
jgi:hypothetical protein